MKKKAALGLAGIAAVAVIGGTWAYWNQDLTATNEFETGKYDSDLKEQFTPPEVGEWVPGESVDKKVWVTNSGDVDMAVGVVLSQEWTSESGSAPSLLFPTGESEEYAAQIGWGEAVVALRGTEQAGEEVGIETAVDSLSDAEGKWVLVGTEENGDEGYNKLYFIYNGVLKPGHQATEVTPLLVEDVTLNSKIEAGVLSKTYEIKDGKATLSDAVLNEYTYEDANYTMTINAKTVQATEEAISEIFASDPFNSMIPGSEVIDEFLDVNKDALIGEAE